MLVSCVLLNVFCHSFVDANFKELCIREQNAIWYHKGMEAIGSIWRIWSRLVACRNTRVHLIVSEVFGGVCEYLGAFGYTWEQNPIWYHKGMGAFGGIWLHSVVFECTFGGIWEYLG